MTIQPYEVNDAVIAVSKTSNYDAKALIAKPNQPAQVWVFQDGAFVDYADISVHGVPLNGKTFKKSKKGFF